jgi:hypothetical protein
LGPKVIRYRYRYYDPKGINYSHLAGSAVWLASQELGSLNKRKVLRRAKQIFDRWLREEQSEIAQHYWPVAITKAEIYKQDYIESHTSDISKSIDRCELESEVYNGLDQIFNKLGFHAGMWFLLATILKERSRTLPALYNFMGIKASVNRKAVDMRFIQKIREVFYDT